MTAMMPREQTGTRAADEGDHTRLVGRRVRRTLIIGGHRVDDEGRVAMIVPSTGGTCLMVVRQDDSVDVWPVDDPTVRCVPASSH